MKVMDNDYIAALGLYYGSLGDLHDDLLKHPFNEATHYTWHSLIHVIEAKRAELSDEINQLLEEYKIE